MHFKVSVCSTAEIPVANPNRDILPHMHKKRKRTTLGAAARHQAYARFGPSRENPANIQGRLACRWL
jgi:hypothetical protein